MKRIVESYTDFVNKLNESNKKVTESKDDEDTHVGFDWGSKFTLKEKEQIEEDVLSHIADMVIDGYTSGDLSGEEPNYSGSWSIDIDYDEDGENDEDSTNEEVARLLKDGYTSGITPSFSISVHIFK